MTTVKLVLTRLNNNNVIVEPSTGKPVSGYVQTINNAFSRVESFDNDLADQADELSSALTQIATIDGLVIDANNNVTALSGSFALTGSYTQPTNVLTAATDALGASTVTIASHTRHYLNGNNVTVNGATISTASGNTYYIYYTDTAQTGGTVAYQHSLSAFDAAQVSGVHCVGVVAVPSAISTTSTGRGALPPGVPA